MAPLFLRAQCLVILAAASSSTALVSTHGSLVEWLSAIPGCVIGPVHVKTSLLGAGRGMVLSRSVLKDEELLVIPRTATISSRTAEADPVLGSELAKLCEAEGERAALAGYLAHQLLNSESETAFLPYVSTLPTVRRTLIVMCICARKNTETKCTPRAGKGGTHVIRGRAVCCSV